MPIIKRRNTPAPAAVAPAPPPEPVAAPAAPPAAPVVAAPSAPAPRGLGKPIALGIAALAVGLAVPFVVYEMTRAVGSEPELEETSEELPERASDIGLDLQQLQKLAAMAELANREHELYHVSRKEAEKLAEPSTLAALDTVLDKNRREFADTRERMAQALVRLHAAYKNSPRQVQRQFDAAIKNANAKNNPYIARVLKVGADALAKAPDDESASEYFNQAVGENL